MTDAEARATYPLHAVQIGRVTFGARRSDDGLWSDASGAVLPWFRISRFPAPAGGIKMKIGAWIVGALWRGFGDD